MNHSLLYLTYQYIKTHPEGFDMNSWGEEGDCGTTACFAGHAALIDGSGYYEEGTLYNKKGGGDNNQFCSFLVSRKLGLSHNRLFHMLCWPKYIQNIYPVSPIEALRQAIVYFTDYNPELSPCNGDSLPTEELVLSVPLNAQLT